MKFRARPYKLLRWLSLVSEGSAALYVVAYALYSGTEL